MITENNNESLVAMAAKMYECRATAKQLLADNYKKQMSERAEIIKSVAQRDNCNEIVAGATIIKESELSGIGLLLILSAVVEIIEPSC